jgi:hypothetical protein
VRIEDSKLRGAGKSLYEYASLSLGGWLTARQAAKGENRDQDQVEMQALKAGISFTSETAETLSLVRILSRDPSSILTTQIFASVRINAETF